jgi:hypothetical protein
MSWLTVAIIMGLFLLEEIVGRSGYSRRCLTVTQRLKACHPMEWKALGEPTGWPDPLALSSRRRPSFLKDANDFGDPELGRLKRAAQQWYRRWMVIQASLIGSLIVIACAV